MSPPLLGKKLDRDEHQDMGEGEAVLPAAETPLRTLSEVWPAGTRYASDVYADWGQGGRGFGGSDPGQQLTCGGDPHT